MKIKVGLLTMSDERTYLYDEAYDLNISYQNDIKRVLEDTGDFEVFAGSIPIGCNADAKTEAEKLRQAGVDVTIINYAIWCYPHLTAIATGIAPGPYLLFCNLHPSECGMVGMLAAAGALDQLDRRYGRIWGSIKDPEVSSRVMAFLRAASVINRLKGQTFGNFGGRPMGMYTAVSNLDQWQRMFGIDVENIEQDDIIREGELIEIEKVEKALQWLESHVGNIAYDGKGLTPDKLRLQIRSYYALRRIIDKRHLDFIGIKAHGDLTDRYVTMDIAEAFLNDPYDWDGAHEPIVASTESDMDGALTMQLLKMMTGKPTLFSDVRHYDKQNDVWFFSNSGTHATFFANASYDPKENLKDVTFYPETHYYPAAGASVHHFAASGKFTFARFTRKNGSYRLTIVPAEIVRFNRDKMLELGGKTTPEWPVAFARLSVSPDYFLSNYPCNHIHGVYGDHVDELLAYASLMNIETVVYK